jgi:hypothetical protein
MTYIFNVEKIYYLDWSFFSFLILKFIISKVREKCKSANMALNFSVLFYNASSLQHFISALAYCVVSLKDYIHLLNLLTVY